MDDNTRAFLARLWRAAPYSYYWNSSSKASQWTPTSPPDDCALGASGVYFGVHPTHEPRGKFERSRIEDIACINCLYSEFDNKDYGSIDAVKAHILQLAVQPSIITYSGGGAHCYWLLNEPAEVCTATIEYIRGTQAAWVKWSGGDNGARDLARVLRLPGTANTKYTPARMVKFARYDIDKAYGFNQLASIADDHWDDDTHAPTAPALPSAKRGGVVAGIVDRLRAAETGTRNSLLFWAACRLFDNGMSINGVGAELKPVALQLGLTEHEINRTITSAATEERKPVNGSTNYRNGNGRSMSLEEAKLKAQR